MHDLLENQEFKRLEQAYPFLSRAREHFHGLENEKFIIVDIETTGLDPQSYEITEIAALKIFKREIVDIFNTLIKPKRAISPEIERITGINDEMVADSPPFTEVAPKFLAFIGSNILVAHNSDFDIPFLKFHLQKKLENQVVCTLKSSRFLLPNLHNHKLHTIAEYFGVSAANRHRALGDAETTFEVWMKMIPLLRDRGIYKKEDLHKIAA